jgi:ribose transport system permease protein
MSGKDAMRFLVRQSYFQSFLFLGALILLFSVLSPYFLSLKNFDNVFSASAVIGLLALGSTFVIASGGIDLSVASSMALSGVICATLLSQFPFSVSVALTICLCVGAACGFINGIFVNLTRAPSFIVTLGMLSVARAIGYIVSDGTPIYGLPAESTWLGQEKLGVVSGPVVILILAAIVAHLLLHYTRFGSHTLIYGDRATTAEALAVPVERLRLKIFTLCGAFSGLAGYVFMARTNSGDPTAGSNYELIAITAVVLGGAKLYGGRATVFGTLLGVLCLGVLQNGLNLLAVSTYYQVLFVGLVLVCAAFLDRMSKEA